MSILSIQSHVTYGYVGNKAATFPLQSLGFDVWPVNTVHFSNHTGYGTWKGEVFSGAHIQKMVEGLNEIGVLDQCTAILSGYMGSADICRAVYAIVEQLKLKNKNLLYLCDPVIGNTSCFVKPEVLDFFKHHLEADIITPNQFEAETLSEVEINDVATLLKATDFFHARGTKLVVVTGIKFSEDEGLYVALSDERTLSLIKTTEFIFPVAPNGTGDLFSAIFLGIYLKTLDPVLALRHAVFYLEKVLVHTLRSEKRELQVISTLYTQVDAGKLPPLAESFERT